MLNIVARVRAQTASSLRTKLDPPSQVCWQQEHNPNYYLFIQYSLPVVQCEALARSLAAGRRMMGCIRFIQLPPRDLPHVETVWELDVHLKLSAQWRIVQCRPEPAEQGNALLVRYC